ncbi:MAG: hypothetical protein JW976_12675, partial [Syntrophaceae bacterium]|nr:hypothetical protein [Syntrophaceae bacterium]
MMDRIKLTFRNILRNKRRSLITICAIGIGFASIGICHGYIYHSYRALRFSAMCGEGLGHLRINKAGWHQKGKLEPDKYIFLKEETEKIMRLVGEEKEVKMITPQIQVTGVVTNGATSAIFIAEGIVPRDEKVLKQYWVDSIEYIDKKYIGIEGRQLSDETQYGVLMAKDLAKYLNLKLGDTGIVMAQTFNNRMNVMDIQIDGIYDTGNDFSNDKFIKLNFYFAQSLLDTQSAERIVVLFKDWRD